MLDVLCSALKGRSVCRPTGVKWLAAAAWNAAIHASELKAYSDTAVLFLSAGRLYAAHPAPDTAALQDQRVSSVTVAVLITQEYL